MHKTWLISWGQTPLGRPEPDNSFNGRIQRLSCIKKFLGEKYNVGFGDYRKSENILESYDWDWGKYGTMTPLDTIITNSTVY